MVNPVVILVETMGTANIGSVARTCAAFGIESFRLVEPRCELDDETRKWACYGTRVLERVERFDSLSEALHDVGWAVGFSRRTGKNRHRHYPLPLLTEKVLTENTATGRIGFLFGNEESGLNREHLSLCHCTCEIPVVAEDGSLNLAHAVSIALYETVGRPRVSGQLPAPKNVHEQTAPPERLADLLKKCESTLQRVGYPRHRSTLQEELVKLETIISRSDLENWEVRLLLGMIKQVDYRLENPK
jgi:tRNA/rRNA methyltransferase